MKGMQCGALFLVLTVCIIRAPFLMAQNNQASEPEQRAKAYFEFEKGKYLKALEEYRKYPPAIKYE